MLLSRRAAIITTAVCVSTAACGLVFDTGALERGSPISASDGGPDVASEVDADAAPSCPESKRGPKLIPTANGQCIDATEVTVADYDTFQQQAFSLIPLEAPCAWLKTFRPTTFDNQLANKQRPVVDVNYCHAFHYCQWAGKRLCGRVDGGEVAPGDAGMDSKTNQWLHACTHGGEQSYSYGTKVMEAACTTRPSEVVDVGTRNACNGPYPGLSDMLGNVSEWIDACGIPGTSDQRDGCSVLGGERVRDEASCWDLNEVSRYWEAPDLGFRCCTP